MGIPRQIQKLYSKHVMIYHPCNFIAVKCGAGRQLAMIKEKVKNGYSIFKWRDRSRSWSKPVEVSRFEVLGFMPDFIDKDIQQRAGKSIRDCALREKEKKNGR